jgi:hypothetical protein
MRMFPGGMRLTLAWTRSPITDGKPSRSSATTVIVTSPLPGRSACRVSPWRSRRWSCTSFIGANCDSELQLQAHLATFPDQRQSRTTTEAGSPLPGATAQRSRFRCWQRLVPYGGGCVSPVGKVLDLHRQFFRDAGSGAGSGYGGSALPLHPVFPSANPPPALPNAAA